MRGRGDEGREADYGGVRGNGRGAGGYGERGQPGAEGTIRRGGNENK